NKIMEKSRILITGVSRGIGREILKQLSQNPGLSVEGTTRDGNLPVDLEEALPIQQLALDNKESRDRFKNILAKQDLQTVIFNAAIYKGSGKEVLEVNFFAQVELGQFFLQSHTQSRKAIFISSGMGELAGFSHIARSTLLDPAITLSELQKLAEDYTAGKVTGFPENPYSTSKGLLNTFTRIAARDFPQHCTVSICPGWVRTDMGGSGAPRSVEKGAETPVWAALEANLMSGKFYRDRKVIVW
ncbi:MAG: hypothetical protein KDK38_16885, partial [Leptospiraceae bacterium]|nr:hypothetical protein [Leptospiraceae bacterium]